jgi:nuclear pore complex protein Nup107
MDLSTHGGDTLDDGLTRMMNCRSQESWRSACLVLANNPNTGGFERAVYALLCGETEPAYRVCQSWGDYLYVFYNHLVLARYREFCKQFQRKMSYAPSSNVTVTLESPAYDSLHSFLDSAKKNDRVGVEARNPYRTIQAAIMSKSYDSFFFHQANAVSKVAVINKSKLVPTTTATDVDDAHFIVAQETDSLRILTHLFLILQSLGYIRSDSHFLETASVSVIGYIDLLQKSGAIKFIPLYASLLPTAMAHTVLGKVLIDVVEAEDRTRHVTLMKNLNIDIAAVLASQWQWVLSEAQAREDTATPIRLKKCVIKQANGPGRIVSVKKDLIGRHIVAEDEHLIRSLDWLRYADGQWPKICSLGTYLYKRFFSTIPSSALVS